MLGACREEKVAEDGCAASRAHDHGGQGDVGETVTLTGQILAENEVSLAYRIGGES